MRTLYSEVEELIQKIDFEAIWPQFRAYDFALYDDIDIYMKNQTIPYDQRFLGNTAIEIEDTVIAIWKVERPDREDPVLLASNIVHEMFHAFQRERSETRYPDDLVLLDYPTSIENFELKYSENLFLSLALKSHSFESKREYFNSFVSCRLYREGILGQMIEQEYRVETIEGMAEYVGLMALKQLSPFLFHYREDKICDYLKSPDERLFYVRKNGYYTGAAICLILKELGIDFYHDLETTNKTLFTFLGKDELQPVKPLLSDDEIESNYEAFMSTRNELFDQFLSNHNEEIQIKANIVGYDPMNMYKRGDEILCSHFILLREVGHNESHYIQGPVLLKMKTGSLREVEAYIRT